MPFRLLIDGGSTMEEETFLLKLTSPLPAASAVPETLVQTINRTPPPPTAAVLLPFPLALPPKQNWVDTAKIRTWSRYRYYRTTSAIFQLPPLRIKALNIDRYGYVGAVRGENKQCNLRALVSNLQSGIWALSPCCIFQVKLRPQVTVMGLIRVPLSRFSRTPLATYSNYRLDWTKTAFQFPNNRRFWE